MEQRVNEPNEHNLLRRSWWRRANNDHSSTWNCLRNLGRRWWRGGRNIRVRICLMMLFRIWKTMEYWSVQAVLSGLVPKVMVIPVCVCVCVCVDPYTLWNCRTNAYHTVKHILLVKSEWQYVCWERVLLFPTISSAVHFRSLTAVSVTGNFRGFICIINKYILISIFVYFFVDAILCSENL